MRVLLFIPPSSDAMVTLFFGELPNQYIAPRSSTIHLNIPLWDLRLSVSMQPRSGTKTPSRSDRSTSATLTATEDALNKMCVWHPILTLGARSKQSKQKIRY